VLRKYRIADRIEQTHAGATGNLKFLLEETKLGFCGQLCDAERLKSRQSIKLRLNIASVDLITAALGRLLCCF
jgi:hypothetical protein